MRKFYEIALALATIFSGKFNKKPYNNSMKNFYTLFILLAASVCALSANDLDNWQLPPEPKPEPTPVQVSAPKKQPTKIKHADDEIVIEMTGTSTVATAATRTDADEIPVFKRTAAQLISRLAGKSRFYVLFNANAVSTFDDTIYADNGARYVLVRYGQEGDNYRKFLFDEGGDQKLLAVADSPATVLAVNKKYNVNIGLTEKEFQQDYPKAVATTVTDAQNNKEYHSYQISGPLFLLFDNGKLAYQFDSAQAFSAYMNTLSAANMGYAAQQAQQQTALEKARLSQTTSTRVEQPTYTTLVVGGTVRAPIYLPVVLSTGTARKLPPLKPSGPPAGTVLMRDVDGKYMNYK